LIHLVAKTCPHCGEDVTSLPVHISFEPFKEKRGLFDRILGSFELSAKEFITIILLFVLFNFIAYASYVRVESPMVVVVGSKTTRSYGVPLEWIQIISAWDSSESRNRGWYEWSLNFERVSINYAALILDSAVYFLLSFAIVYGIAKLRSRKTRIS